MLKEHLIRLCVSISLGKVMYEWITKLYQRGKMFGAVMIKRTYRAAHGAETAYYRTVVRVEFIASLPK